MLALASINEAASMRLMSPTPRVVQRLHRVVIMAAAARKGVCYLDLETRFNLTKSALAHLVCHAPFRSDIFTKFENLAKSTNDYLAVVEQSRPAHAKELRDVMVRLSAEVAKLDNQESVTKERIEEFVELTDALREAALAEGYDPSYFIDQMMYRQAQLIVANYQAYERTLREQ